MGSIYKRGKTFWVKYYHINKADLKLASEKVFSMHQETTEKLEKLETVTKRLQSTI